METYESRKKMFEEIKKFNKTEQEELFRIIKRADEDVSENKNGIFFDLMNLKDETIQEIKKWITFCSKNKETLEEREKEMNDLSIENPNADLRGF